MKMPKRSLRPLNRMAAQNEDAEKIVAAVEQLKKQYDAVFVVDDLKNLVHGGRLSNASAFIGTVLKIKPLLHFDKESDKIVAFEKVRSLKKAMKRAQEIIKEETDKADYPFRLLVIHANNEKRGQEWAKEVQEAFPGIPVSLGNIIRMFSSFLPKKTTLQLMDCKSYGMRFKQSKMKQRLKLCCINRCGIKKQFLRN